MSLDYLNNSGTPVMILRIEVLSERQRRLEFGDGVNTPKMLL